MKEDLATRRIWNAAIAVLALPLALLAGVRSIELATGLNILNVFLPPPPPMKEEEFVPVPPIHSFTARIGEMSLQLPFLPGTHVWSETFSIMKSNGEKPAGLSDKLLSDHIDTETGAVALDGAFYDIGKICYGDRRAWPYCDFYTGNGRPHISYFLIQNRGRIANHGLLPVLNGARETGFFFVLDSSGSEFHCGKSSEAFGICNVYVRLAEKVTARMWIGWNGHALKPEVAEKMKAEFIAFLASVALPVPSHAN